MDERSLLNEIADSYKKILKDNLIGIYVHGSIAFGCFHWERSDIDFLVVTERVPSLKEKIELVENLLYLEPQAPKKGFEMSLILEKYCKNFVYPTPFELHFSNAHIKRCKDNLDEYCAGMNGTDKDLAAHFMVTKKAGIVLYGKDISSVFGTVDRTYYLDSIIADVSDAENEISQNPVYVILNLCRVLAYIEDGVILSKEQGGQWGIENLPKVYAPVITAALKYYCKGEKFTLEHDLVMEFASYAMSIQKLS